MLKLNISSLATLSCSFQGFANTVWMFTLMYTPSWYWQPTTVACDNVLSVHKGLAENETVYFFCLIYHTCAWFANAEHINYSRKKWVSSILKAVGIALTTYTFKNYKANNTDWTFFVCHQLAARKRQTKKSLHVCYAGYSMLIQSSAAVIFSSFVFYYLFDGLLADFKRI